MKYGIYALVLLSLLSLNLGIFDGLEIRNQIPNFLFLFSIFFVLNSDGFDFYFVSLFSGLLLDFYSTGFFGAYTLAMILVTFSAYLFTHKVTIIEFKFKNLALFLAFCLAFFQFVVWFYNFVVFKLNFSTIQVGFNYYLNNFFVSYLYNLVFLYPIFLFYSLVKNLVLNLNIKRRGVIR